MKKLLVVLLVTLSLTCGGPMEPVETPPVVVPTPPSVPTPTPIPEEPEVIPEEPEEPEVPDVPVEAPVAFRVPNPVPMADGLMVQAVMFLDDLQPMRGLSATLDGVQGKQLPDELGWYWLPAPTSGTILVTTRGGLETRGTY